MRLKRLRYSSRAKRIEHLRWVTITTSHFPFLTISFKSLHWILFTLKTNFNRWLLSFYLAFWHGRQLQLEAWIRKWPRQFEALARIWGKDSKLRREELSSCFNLLGNIDALHIFDFTVGIDHPLPARRLLDIMLMLFTHRSLLSLLPTSTLAPTVPFGAITVAT